MQFNLLYMMDANTLFLVLEGVDFSVYDNHVVCTGGWVVGMFIGCFNYLFCSRLTDPIRVMH